MLLKGDLPNLLLAFPDFEARSLVPWVEPGPGDRGPDGRDRLASKLADARRVGLEAWGIGLAELADYNARTHVRVITPGADAGDRVVCRARPRTAR